MANRFNRIALLCSLAFWLVVGAASIAWADALVVVQLRPEGTPDGRVSLTPAGAREPTHTCETRGGSCRIASVPGGQYTVRFHPASGQPPAASSAMIPPSGTVTLHVAAR